MREQTKANETKEEKLIREKSQTEFNWLTKDKLKNMTNKEDLVKT